ncbi:MAG: MCE family protein [Deltaproteobacteria bacterium]|nr:MAG: MCE family protein [Deltaproteobacteria bacterium]
MPEADGREHASPAVADAVIEERSRLSIVWVIPIVAVLVGTWLAYRAFTERGPLVTITFESAAGLEAGKTKVKYKDVEIGAVEQIDLSADLSGVVVQARLGREATRYLTENTRFWVVRAQVSAGRVSGLSTLFSGAYIGIDPSTEGRPQRHFQGLPVAPVVTSDVPGRLFTLRAKAGGSLEVGSPVYYRSADVGDVVASELDESGNHVTVKVFLRAPHDQRVRKNTRFWNVSGIDLRLSPEGLELDTVSLTSLLIGGAAFDTPKDQDPGGPVEEGAVFELYPNRRAMLQPKLTVKRPFLLHFEGSVGGLVDGAPVEFRGIQVGEVRNVRLEFDADTNKLRIPVLIELQPERIALNSGGAVVSIGMDEVRRNWDDLVARGMRAQLQSGNLLTGQLAIGLDFHPDAPPAKINWDAPIPELPTIPSPIEELKTGLSQFVKRLSEVPLEQVGNNLNKTLEQLERTLASANALIAPDSEAGSELRRLLRDLADAAQSIRLLADHLEQHPEDLIRGKGAE